MMIAPVMKKRMNGQDFFFTAKAQRTQKKTIQNYDYLCVLCAFAVKIIFIFS